MKKIIFISNNEVGLPIFNALIECGAEICAVFTSIPEEKNKICGYYDYEKTCQNFNLPIYKVHDLNSAENVALIRKLSPDVIFEAGWQKLIRREILEIPREGTIGFHSSLLPKYRGRAPVNWAIIMGERETGITMFYLTPEADAGDIIAQKKVEILFNDDCCTVYKKCAIAGAALLKKHYSDIINGTVEKSHNESRNFPAYSKRTPEDGIIDFKRSSLDIYNFIRALTRPYPGAFYYNHEGRKIVVYKAEIIFDNSRIDNNDIILTSKDYKLKVVDWEYGHSER